MSPEILANMQNQINDLESAVNTLKNKISALGIDSQIHLKANQAIKPGIATKVAYDSKGLILKGENLEVSDIPMMPIDKIENLRTMLEEKASVTDLKRITVSREAILKKGAVYGTACKVNYDEHGFVLNGTDLTESDIPQLTMKKIEGLQAELEAIKRMIPSAIAQEDNYNVNPGTYPKITYDEKGRVVNGENLNTDDLPISIITKINELDAKIHSLAMKDYVDSLMKDLRNKADKTSIPKGLYCRVRVNEQGMIEDGGPLTKADLPEMEVDDIKDLMNTLRSKAERSVVNDLQTTVNTLTTSMNRIGDLLKMKSLLTGKAESTDVKDLQRQVESMRTLVDQLVNSLPSDRILDELRQLREDISSLSGRLSSIESNVLK